MHQASAFHLVGPFVIGATCVLCGKTYSPQDAGYVCPCHGDEGILDVNYNYQAARSCFPGTAQPDALARLNAQPGLWRYRALLPLPWDAAVPALHVGMTPLYAAPHLAQRLGLAQVWIKDDTRQPTGSFKDRASCLGVALAKQGQVPVIATASTGNAAAALAGMAAAHKQPCVIFVPSSAPPAKIAQLQAYGATIFLVQGSYDQAFELCMEACRTMGWYNRNTAYNPCMAEGKKTAAFEIAEQLHWQVPQALFVGVGDGCIMAGLHKGFCDLERMGLIDRVPRLYGVQAAGSDFLAQAQDAGLKSPQALLTKAPIAAHTVADSISAGLPRDRVKAMNAMVGTKGSFIRVSDAEILAAIPELAAQSGVFAEPAAAAALAGLHRALELGLVQPEESVCLMITGNGLKDIASAMQACQPLAQPVELAANSAALQKVLAAKF